jgi:hypothetical protein
MRARVLQTACIAALLATSIPAAGAQRPDVGFARRDSVVIAVPLTAATEWKLGGFMGVAPRFVFDASLAESGEAVVKDSTGTVRTNWRAAGFPSALHFMVEQINQVRRPGGVKATEVVLRSGVIAGRVFVPEGQEAAVRQVIAPLAKADSVYRAGYRALGEVFFTGPLASFTEAERSIILTWAHLTAGGSFVGNESYRGANYFTVNVPGDGNTWNDLVVRQNQRIGKILSDRFPMMKAFARLSIPHQAIGGVKLSTKSCHGHAPNYTDMRCDPVEIYFPLNSLIRFADDEITSQQLVTESVVRVSGDRIEVDLSNQ